MTPLAAQLPSGVTARPLNGRDLAAALTLSAEAGWNQTAADWQIFLDLGSAVGVTGADGRLIATAATLPHANRFAWISMVLVTAAQQRKGLARWLLRDCIERLTSRQLVPVLDATPAGRSVYSGLGFRDAWSMRRLVGLVGRAAQSPRAGPAAEGVTVRRLDPAYWPEIIAYDTAVFGADRGALLRRLAGRLPQAALIAEREGRLAGFLLGRDGRIMNQLGPLVAESDQVARALLGRAFAAVALPLAVDVPDRHAGLGGWLLTLGFTAERPLTRMVYGTSAAFDDLTRLFAIAGPELG
ncbi:MAG TPA: GNAT family N-acetyltransferase [Xanthobacteraceae bacterium]|jgi:GNAT superfamily N-acetyltransferase|nr:GNAT family N-acetyltransferase [Xanthobacteraceae bacterium]